MTNVLTHDEYIKKALDVIQKTDLQKTTSAFLASLSTKNLLWRAGLPSFIVLQHLKKHEFESSKVFHPTNCHYCGLNKTQNELILDKFEYLHCDYINQSVSYLESFIQLNIPNPTPDDIIIFKNIIRAIKSLPKNAQLTQLEKSIQGQFKSNKFQRISLLYTLGYMGILLPQNTKCYHDKFLTYDFIHDEQSPHFYKNDWKYPVRFWTGIDGVNDELLYFYFKNYL